MGNGMTPYWEPFAELILRDEGTLTADEACSLEYFTASTNDIHGLPAKTDAQRWCRLAREVAALARELGRMPEGGDDGVAPRHLTWIAAQRTADLNTFQKCRLESIQGWSAD